MRLAHHPNTLRNKRSQAAIYQRFCESHNLTEMPADKWQLCRYAIYTAKRVTSHGTVDNYVGGVRSLQQLAGYNCPPPSSPNLKLVMHGIKAYLAKPVRQAAPVTLEMLEKNHIAG